MFHMSAKHVLGGQLKMNVLDVRETPFGRTSRNTNIQVQMHIYTFVYMYM